MIYSRDQHRRPAETGKLLYFTSTCCGLNEKQEKVERSSLMEGSLEVISSKVLNFQQKLLGAVAHYVGSHPYKQQQFTALTG